MPMIPAHGSWKRGRLMPMPEPNAEREPLLVIDYAAEARQTRRQQNQ